ncbi:SGNH hydrolase [Coniochaeta ligniaria NRRL 30616]|uniref:SGNH hydrolase n=1 Tax=Coniochaeta ligniaria NRRL 30616 TaxID=1408157 RepID=A0A1J7I5H1_9PEZI|nr:SGNH hydrolase [Coniochaeta ligniaria NRRL 30616]
MASLLFSWLVLLVLSSSPLTAGHPRGHRHHHNNTSRNPRTVLSRRDTDPTDFSWISRWAAIGDSFTAGIGSGYQLGIPLTDDWFCSRYSYSWVKILNYAFGPTVKNFQYPACSGDRTEQIFNQATNLNGPLDLVMMTAGGNDLCLATMITNCIFLAWRGEDVCTQILDKAQENIDTILKDNIRDILSALNGVIKPGGYMIYSGYAPFFDTTNEDCGDLSKQYWAIKEWWWWSYWFSTPLKLTVDRRTKFNTLVANINQAISDVVDEYSADTSIKYKITYSDWSDWGAEVDGQMCSPNGVGLYPEPGQEELQFIKRNTYVAPPAWRELRRRSLDQDAHVDTHEEARVAVEQAIGGPLTEEKRQQFLDHLEAKWAKVNIYDSLLWKSRNPRAEVLHKLDSRAPSPPNCPGDDSPDPTLGIGLPDKVASNFHPNERGHENMAAFALENLVWLRAKELNVQDPICQVTDAFTCWQASGKKAFANGDRMNENYKDFCDAVDKDHPTNTLNWSRRKTYHAGTQDEHEMYIQLSNDASAWDKNQCLDSFSRIINGCDGNDPNNPLDFKFGGSYVRGDYEYQVNPKHDRTLITEMTGDCKGDYKFLWGSYTLRGSGWASSDFGQNTLLSSAKSCVGGGITKWSFDYCLDGDQDCGGYEWKATFRTPIWVRTRCFNNDKVQKGAGGSTNGVGWGQVGCSGSD